MSLNSLIKRQNEIKAMADALEGKFKKVSDVNRKENYFVKRINELKKLQEEFEENDVAIEEQDGESTERTAYEENQTFKKTMEVMKKARNMYEAAFEVKFPKSDLGKAMEDPEKHNATIAVREENNKKMELTSKTYTVRAEALTELTTKIMARIDEIESTIELEHEMKKVESALASYNKAYEEIIVAAADDWEMENFKLDYQDVSNIADRVILTCKKKMAKICLNPEAPKLQALKVPKFRGECHQWVPFLNLFTKTVKDNSKLTKVQKLQYLMDSLENEPKKLIHHLDICDENFDSAMEILMRRYNDQRRIVNNHLDAILDTPPATDEAKSLKVVYDTIAESLYALKGQNIEGTALAGALLVRILEKKLNARTRQSFEESLSEKRKVPALKEYLQFIEERFISMESVSSETKGATSTNNHQPGTSSKNTGKRECAVCSGQHSIHQCGKFNQMNSFDRNDTVRKAKLCKNCLKGHAGRCNMSANCSKCNGYHHVALHYEKRREGARDDFRGGAQSHIINTENDEFDVMLATARIRAKTRDGEYIELRALIDQGSTASFISEKAAQRMRLSRLRNSTVVTGIGANETEAVHGSTNVCIKPRYPSEFETSVDALILSKLTTYGNTVDQKWKHTEDLTLADPEYCRSEEIDMILGADIFAVIALDGVRKGPANTPIAQETLLGWILSGRVKRTSHQLKVVSLISNGQLENKLENFWKIEELQGDNVNHMTNEEQMCEKFYHETVRRDKDGRYVTKLPFKNTDIGLGKSRHIAVATLLQMEKKFKHNPELKKEYSKCINEYLELEHMQPATTKDESLTTMKNGEKVFKCYYLPHHAVMKTTSTTTKLRVVFNASQKSSNGVSLNELLMVGPTIQDDLMNILIRWRGHRIALAADIEKMYRQIHVDETDYDYQRIVWRNDEEEPIRDYCLKRVTFGNASAPFMAIRTIKQLAMDESSRYPNASEVAQRDCYVDDLLTGTHTVEDAKKMQIELRKMMETGGMNLRKWASNEKAALEDIPDEHRELKADVTINSNETLKMLGVQWDPSTDEFLYKIELKADKQEYTKRELVSEVARIFDPLGWLAPVVVMAKIRLQETWILGIEWDEKITNEMTEEWNRFKTTLRNANDIRLPRYVGLGFDDVHYELHGFCDASMKAYAAVVYLRSKQANGNVEIHLVAAKSRVAPTKTISLPRLELCGAVLLGKLMKKVKRALGREFETFAWTDSTIALAWITGDSHRWETFVANRTTSIQEDIPGHKWHHVGTKENPADLASRGVDATTLKECVIWWQGPEWLKAPSIKVAATHFETTEGIRKRATLHTNIDKQYNEFIGRFSSLDKLKRVIAYCLRFSNNCRGNKVSGRITVTELKQASTALIKWAQSIDFGTEIGALSRKDQLKTNTGIAALNPIIADGVLRVGGRIQSENLAYDRRHPAILAYSNPLTPLIIQDAHTKTLHGGNTLTLAYIRQKYWILKSKRAVKFVLRRCVKCTRFRAEMQQQQMGNLPVQRTTEARPFLFTGVDFCGPFNIRASGGRGVKSTKGYIAVFICLVTKAIHLEAVSDLTSRAFIAALHRMRSRRGHVAKLFSDNGTNFVGANKMIRDEYRTFVSDYQEEISAELTRLSMEWEFIPPSAPNFGGLWEAGVKSVKYHLKRTVGDAMLTYEELITALNQIEACLNSRPLCALTEDPNELVLTPAHFLIGDSFFAHPEADYTGVAGNRLKRWELCQKMQQDFWKNWRDEYLTRLQQRTKWITASRNLEKDDVVLVKDERTPSSVWPLGRITDTHEGKDGLVRVVDVKIGKKTFRRPVSKICLLPVRDEDSVCPPGRDVEKKSTSRTVQKHSISFTTILLMFGLLSCAFGQAVESFEIEKIRKDPGIYFEKIGKSSIMEGRWSILAYYDLDQYLESLNTLNDGLDYWSQQCNNFGADCRSLSQQLDRRMSLLKEKNELLQHSRPRRRRAVVAPFLGGATAAVMGGLLINWLTKKEGISCANTIDTLATNQNHLHDLMQNQMSVLNITSSVMKDSLEELNGEQARMRQELYKGDVTTKLYAAALQHMVMIETYADTQNGIINAITSTHHGRLHPTLISVQQVTKQIGLMKNHLPTGLRLPGDNDDDIVRHVYRTAEVRIGFAKGKLIFRIMTPLLRDVAYSIWRVIPIPMLTNGTLTRIRTIAEYLLIDAHNQTYYDMKKDELSRCKDDEGEVICELHHPVYQNGAMHAHCEMELFMNKPGTHSSCQLEHMQNEETWIQLDDTRKWIFAMDHPRGYNMTCDGQKSPIELTGTGLLTLKGNCSMTGESIHLASNHLRQQLSGGYAAFANLPIEITTQNSTRPNLAKHLNTTEMDNALRELRANMDVKLLNVSVHDWHHYAAIYGLIIICGLSYLMRNLIHSARENVRNTLFRNMQLTN